MEQIRLIVDLALAVLAAFVGGAIAQRLGQPVILGYLVAGLAIGPFTPGPSADQRNIELLAEIGVAFLMFALGAEVSFAELRSLGRLAWLGGPLQILLTMALGLVVAPALDLNVAQGVYLGGLIALSSTVVVLKVLMGRGELQTLHGKVALGILIAQDMAVVPMAIVLPALAAGGERLLLDLALAGGKVALVLTGVYVVGARLVPWMLTRAAFSRTRELFILSVVTLALGTAALTNAAGLSLAFGAFLAGLIVAESDYRTQVIAEVLPLRDLFAALFFVSIGMLVDPRPLAADAGLMIAVTAVVVIGKALIGGAVVRLLGLPANTALLTGLSLAQIGEFSFVLARIGVVEGAIPSRVFDSILAAALLSIVITPFLLRLGPTLERVVDMPAHRRSRPPAPLADDVETEGLEGHTIVCGYGRVGRELSGELALRGEPFVVVEYDAATAKEARTEGMPVVFGNAGSPVVLEHCRVGKARLLAVLVPNSHAAELATRYAREANASIDIIARASHGTDVARLLRAGATEVVQPEFEAGVEVIRHALGIYGIDPEIIEERVASRRRSFYKSELD